MIEESKYCSEVMKKHFNFLNYGYLQVIIWAHQV